MFKLGLSRGAYLRIAKRMKLAQENLEIVLTVGRGLLRRYIDEALVERGIDRVDQEEVVGNIENRVIQEMDEFESWLEADWAAIAYVTFDESENIEGYIKIGEEREPLEEDDLYSISSLLEDFVAEKVESETQALEPEELLWIPVDSSNVGAFAYDDENRDLYVKFKAKGNQAESIYIYNEVEPEIYDAFFAAPSKGRFVWTYLRDRYPYQRIACEE